MRTLILAVVFVSLNVFAKAGDRGIYPNSKGSRNVPFEWVGEVQDLEDKHSSDHELNFVRDDNKTFDIIESPELVKFQHESGKNHMVKITGERTPTYLFVGSKLIVKSFEVLKETSSIAPAAPTEESRKPDSIDQYMLEPGTRR